MFTDEMITFFQDVLNFTEDYSLTNSSYETETTDSPGIALEIVPTWQKVWAHLLMLNSAITIVGNGLVIATIMRSRDLRSRTNELFVANLAAADLCFGGFVVSMMGDWVLGNRWRFGDIPCQLILWAEITVNAISNNAVACLSISKFVYVAHPLHYERWMTKTVVILMLCFTWMAPMIYTAPGYLGQLPTVTIAYFPETCEFVLSQAYLVIGSLLLFTLPLVLTVFLGVRVLIIAQQHRRKIASIEMMPDNPALKRSSWRALRSYLMVVSAYLILQGPLYMSAFIQAACYCVPHIWFYDYLAYPFWIGGMVNPFIYFFAQKNYRRSFYRVVTCGRYNPPSEDGPMTDN